MIYFVVPRPDDFCIQDYLNLYAPSLVTELTVVYYEDLPKRLAVPSGTYVFSTLDHLTSPGLRLVQELADQLVQPGTGCRVINHPRHTLLRPALLETLHREGLNPHRAVNAAGDLAGLRFPVFVREAFQHTGAITLLLQNDRELSQALCRAVLLGYDLSTLLVVEFLETADGAGCYRKYAAHKIGSEIVADGVVQGRQWMLKANDTDLDEAKLLEERAFILENPHKEALQRIFDVAHVDYGRLDYAIRDGTVVTWEINLNPIIRRGRRSGTPQLSAELDRIKDVARQHFLSRFEAAIRRLDSSGSTGTIQLAYSDGCRAAAYQMIRPRDPRGWPVRLANLVRPIVPALGLVSQMFSPLVVRAARRRARN